MPTQKSIQQIAEEVEKIYQDYEAQLKVLEAEQSEVINDFREKLEQKKIEEIRKSLNNWFYSYGKN